MLTNTLRGFALALCLPVVLPALAGSDEQQQMLEQLAQLDELDHQDFLKRNAKANACIEQRDFDCATAAIERARRLAKNAQDKAALQLTRENLALEQELLASEQRSRRQREEAEEADRRAEEQAIRAQELAEEREAERQRTKYAAMAAGLALGGGGQLSPERQAQLLSAIQRDSYSQGSDTSNFNAAADSIRHDQQRQAQEREELRARQRELQQRQQQARAEAREQAQDQAQEQARQAAAARRQQMAEAAATNGSTPTAAERPQIVQYVSQKVVLPTWDSECPAGSSPARHPNGTTVTAGSGTAYCVKDNGKEAQQLASASGATGSNGAGKSTAGGAAGASGKQAGASGSAASDKPQGEKKSAWGEVKPEALAICRQSQKSRMWECNGALDDQTIVDEPTVESALKRQHCAGGTLTVGGPVIKGQQWQVYQCGHSLGPGDYDVAKRYDLVTPRRSYICKAYFSGRCDTPYTGQDKQ